MHRQLTVYKLTVIESETRVIETETTLGGVPARQ